MGGGDQGHERQKEGSLGATVEAAGKPEFSTNGFLSECVVSAF